MRKILLGLCLSVVVVAAGWAAQDTKKAQSFNGEIMDSACAMMGSHAAMMKKEGTKDAADCTKACVGAGSKYVLYNASTKTTYQLDDQSKPAQFAGDKVTVMGSYDKSTKTIAVSDIKAAKS